MLYCIRRGREGEGGEREGEEERERERERERKREGRARQLGSCNYTPLANKDFVISLATSKGSNSVQTMANSVNVRRYRCM